MKNVHDERKIEILLNKIENNLNIIQIKKFGDTTITAILVWCRQLIEISNSESEHSFIKFFADWCAHPGLSGIYKLSEGIFQNIKKNIKENNKIRISKGRDVLSYEEEKELYVQFISLNYLSLRKLREDLIKFLQEYKIKVSVLENEGEWFVFRKNLLDLLSFTPIYFIVNSEKKKIPVLSVCLDLPENSEMKKANPEVFVYDARFHFQDGYKVVESFLDGSMSEETKNRIKGF